MADFTDFQDPTTYSKLIRYIAIRAGEYIDSIQIFYEDGTQTEQHGGSGGSPYQFNLDDDEAILSVFKWSGIYTDAIQFQTSHGRLSQKYGGGGGGLSVLSSIDPDGKGHSLCGFFGTSGKFCNDLEPGWSSTHTYETRYTVTSDQRGGSGGSQFSDLREIANPISAGLKSIVVRSGDLTDSLQCYYRDGQAGGQNGGGGGSQSIFDLDPDEYITSIEVRTGSEVDAITFVTNKERRSPQYGNPSGGIPSVWSASDIGAGYALFGFSGRSVRFVDALAPVWATNSPIEYRLEKVTYADFSSAVDKEGVQFDKAHITNNTAVEQSTSTNVSIQYSVTQTHTLSQSTRVLIGTKTEFTYETPELKFGSGGVSFEISSENEWTTQTTDGHSKTTTLTKQYTVPINVPPQSTMDTQVFYWSTTIQSLKWTGTMTVTYLDGSTKSFPADGTFSGALCSMLDITYTETPIPAPTAPTARIASTVTVAATEVH